MSFSTKGRNSLMKIVIVGGGKVGLSLAEHLSQETHDVTLVDVKESIAHRAADMLDIMSIRGNGISAEILHQAGANTADLLVAVTSSDEVNMVCCLLSKNMGARYTIARIRNPEYSASLAELRRNLKIDVVLNPESATALEISRLLRFPVASNIETFCRGKVELMGFCLLKDDFLVGAPLSKLTAQVKRLSLLICAAERDGQVTIPNGAFVPQEDDTLYIIGRPDSLDQFFRLLGRYTPKVKDLLIIGGGKITGYLIPFLGNTGMRIKVIEKDEPRCRQLSEYYPQVTVIHGDGTDQELLESENAFSTDALVTLTDQDENNLIISLYALQKGHTKVIAKCNRQNYAGIAHSVGLGSIVSPKFITASYILRLARGMENSQGNVMISLHRIAGGIAEAVEFSVGPSTRHLGKPLSRLSLKPSILIAVIMRGQEIIIPEGNTHLAVGDKVIIVSRDGGILDINDIYLEASRGL